MEQAQNEDNQLLKKYESQINSQEEKQLYENFQKTYRIKNTHK